MFDRTHGFHYVRNTLGYSGYQDQKENLKKIKIKTKAYYLSMLGLASANE